MSEQEPLLPTRHDPESGDAAAAAVESSSLHAYREKTADFLESHTMHKTVIALIVLDATCVLVDIGYSFLSGQCDTPDNPTFINVLSLISLIITTFFLFEIPLTLWAIGTDFYHPRSDVHHSSLHLFDAFIIVTTFTLEFALKGRERELSGLLILFRLWRLVKLVGGIAVGAGELEEQTAKELMRAKRELKETQQALEAARKENEELKKKLSSVQPSP